jgi:hypothetical protein
MTSRDKSTIDDADDPTSLPDFHTEFIDSEDLHQFEKALNAPEAEPLVAINDWRPIRERVRKPRGRRKTPRRT